MLHVIYKNQKHAEGTITRLYGAMEGKNIVTWRLKARIVHC
jgi:hypothetical protein